MATVGLGTPVNRSLIFGAVGLAVETMVKPSVSYKENGVARPFAFTNPQNEDATYLPPGSLAVILAVIGGVFF